MTAFLHRVLAVLYLTLPAFAPAAAGEWEFSGSVEAELRMFPYGPAFAGQEEASFSPSLAMAPELVYESGSKDDRFTFIPFLRWDRFDDNRSHIDIREANWLHLGEDWDMVVGFEKIFWGVTESRHLIDIVNQTDAVEDIDDEDKLGQPMVNFNLETDWGTFGVFVLPGFRPRIFPDENARRHGMLPIDDRNPVYESDAGAAHVDWAVRWKHIIEAWELGIAHFQGTSRAPRLVRETRSGQFVLVPHYDQIDQTSIDIQLTAKSTLWKLEAITRAGHGDRFAAVVGGFEHTFYGVFGTRADIGVLGEYQYDGRGDDAPATSADDDIFSAIRLTLNDAQDTAVLGGAVVDRNTGASLLFIEGQRRIGDAWKIALEGRFMVNIPDDDPVAAVREDDSVTLRLSRFF